MPILGALLRLLWGVQGDSATDRALRIIGNEVGSIRSELVALNLQQLTLAGAVRGLTGRPLELPQVETTRDTGHPESETAQEHSLGMPQLNVAEHNPDLGQNASNVLHQLTSKMRIRQLKGMA